jgi:hypothetical protein
MNPSSLLLENHFFEEITIKHHSGVKSGNKIVANDLKVNAREMQDDENPRKWIFELTIELPESATPKSPYTFHANQELKVSNKQATASLPVTVS